MAGKRKRQTRWVIFAGPEQRGGPGTRYIGNDGTSTDSRGRAAKFFSFESAQEFANEKGVVLDGVMRYIGQMDFSEWDLRED